MYTLNNEILESFSAVNKAIYKLIKMEADRLGITVVQLKAIYRISVSPNVTLGELAEKLRLTNSTVSGVIDRLVQSGYVKRVVPPENRRSVLINLTISGEELLEQILTSDSVTIKKVNELMEIPKDEIQHLLRLHKLVLSRLTLEEE